MKLKFDSKSVCLADFKHPIQIMLREIKPPVPNSVSPEEVFTLVFSPFAAIKTFDTFQTGGFKKFDGLNIADNVTHIFCIQYCAEYAGIETKNNFVLFKSQYYKIESVINIDEYGRILFLQCSVRGAGEPAKA